MEEDEIMACMSLKKWNEIVALIERLRETNNTE